MLYFCLRFHFHIDHAGADMLPCNSDIQNKCRLKTVIFRSASITSIPCDENALFLCCFDLAFLLFELLHNLALHYFRLLQSHWLQQRVIFRRHDFEENVEVLIITTLAAVSRII